MSTSDALASSGVLEPDEPADRRAWSGLWVLATALGMIVLDGTIVAVALPAMIAGLHLSLTDAQWVTSLYSVIFAALLLTAGRLGDRWGRRRLLVIGLALFVVGSILGGLAGSSGALLLARAVQGVGGAAVLPATLSTVNATFRGRDRAAAFGIWGAVMAGAAALGPLLGGMLTEWGSWRLVFWVNVPVGLVVIALALRLVDENRGLSHTGIDLPGPVLSAVGFGLVVFGLIEGSTLGWWTPKAAVTGLGWPADAPVSPVPVALVLGLAALVAFAVVESRRQVAGRATILDLRLFRLPTFVFGNATALLVAVGEFALLFVLPLYLVTSLQATSLVSGLVLASMALGAFASGAAARHLAAAIGPTRVVVVGLALEVLGAGATALVMGHWSSPWAVAATLLPYGLGLGLASAQLTSTVLRDVPPEESGTGSATQSTVRQLGAALGGALGGAVLAGTMGSQTLGGPGRAGPFGSAAATAVWAAVGVLGVALLSSVVVDRVSRDGIPTPPDPATR